MYILLQIPLGLSGELFFNFSFNFDICSEHVPFLFDLKFDWDPDFDT